MMSRVSSLSRCAVLFILAAGGCTVGPDYQRPAVAVPVQVPETAAVASTGIRITAEAPWARWWEVFGDSELNRLVTTARSGNEDLRAALARVRAARAIAGEAFAPMLPQVGAGAGYSYGQASKNANPSLLSAGKPQSLFAWSADAGYELDLFGRIRRGLEAAESDASASEEDRKTVEIVVLSETALGYFELGEAEAELAIERESVAAFENTRALVQVLFKNGIAPELDLRRAEGAREDAAAAQAEGERRRQVAEHRLALLLGRLPDVRFTGKAPRVFTVPPEIPVGLPSSLLERRPDVRAAEERLHAATARVGEAEADFFPRVTILGNFGSATLSAGTLVQPASQWWSIAPSIRIPIFEGGATTARWNEMQARTDEAAANYRQMVLRAFSEVADALSGIAGHIAQRDRLAAEVTAQERAVALAETTYRQGLTTYLNVLDAQRALLGSRLALVRAQLSVLADIVSLQKALGGGWSEP
jgi:NodT family efflux transporter outer membrane factor (OMF) lipoprotein